MYDLLDELLKRCLYSMFVNFFTMESACIGQCLADDDVECL